MAHEQSACQLRYDCSPIAPCNYDAILFETTGAIAAVGGYIESQLSVGITDLHCNGSEASIFNCNHNNLEQYNCASRDDAGVICQGQYLLSVAIVKYTL